MFFSFDALSLTALQIASFACLDFIHGIPNFEKLKRMILFTHLYYSKYFEAL